MSGSEPTPDQRQTLAQLADLLVPEGLGMPAASTVGVDGHLLDRFLAAVPSYCEPLLALLDEAPADDLDGFVRRLAEDSSDDFSVLSTTIVGAYYLSAEVRELIGYPGQEPSPFSVASEPDYLDMLERVHERHPGYRECS